MTFSSDDIEQVLGAFHRSGWDEMRLVTDGLAVVVSKSGDVTLAPAGSSPAADPALPSGPAHPVSATEPASTAVPPTPPPTTAPVEHADGVVVTAPFLGLFWRSPKPGAPPFIDVGDPVGADDTICIIEVMKLMNHIKAGAAGIVVAVHVENGEMVEYGQALMTIAPAGDGGQPAA